jgi:hypothetical protein
MPHKDPEVRRQYLADWNSKNKEEQRAARRDYYAANRERLLAYQREYKEQRREELKGRRRSHYVENPDVYKARNLRKFGITLDQFNAAMKAQGGVCAICKRPSKTLHASGKVKDLAVDHDHETGRFRGLLCTSCNNGLGRFKDSPDLLAAAIAYLKGV